MPSTDPTAIVAAYGYRPIDPYPGSTRLPWRVQCTICGRIRRPRLSAVIRNAPGARCSHSSRGARIPDAITVADMRLYVGEPIDPNPGVSYPWRTRCQSCGRIVHPRLLQARHKPNPKAPCHHRAPHASTTPDDESGQNRSTTESSRSLSPLAVARRPRSSDREQTRGSTAVAACGSTHKTTTPRMRC